MIHSTNDNHDYFTLLLSDYHTEYPLPEVGTCKPDIVFDGDALEDIFGEEAVIQLWRHAPKPLADEFGDMYHLHIWHVAGSYDQIAEVLDAFCKTIFAPPQYSPKYDFFLHTPSGDDDAFDYWPIAVDLAKQIANDLDTINPEGKQYEKLRQRYIDFINKGGSIIEFNFDDTTSKLEATFTDEKDEQLRRAWEQEIGKHA